MYTRATFSLLLLLGLLAGGVVPAQADTITFNLSITWVDTGSGIQPPPITMSTGSVTIDKTLPSLVSYSIDVPAPFVTPVTEKNSQHWLFVQGPTCGSNVPCFEIQIAQDTYDPYSHNVILLTFAGSLANYMGGAILNVNGAISKAQCGDPCQYYAYGNTTVAEPASVVLLGCGLALAAGVLRRRMRS